MIEKSVLVTGGAGFIGSHVVRHFVKNYPQYQIVNYDLLTYAGNLNNLSDVENAKNYQFVKGDIQDKNLLKKVFQKYKIESVIHLAAESHVDKSIKQPLKFVHTNIVGTLTLLNVCLEEWRSSDSHRFYHISTDEVYGSLAFQDRAFTEKTPYDPQSPYSASKASSDHFVRSYHNTYQLPIVISNCSNNYGPNQFPEKLIPLALQNILKNKPIPIYNKGENIRDWLYVADHAQAIDIIFHKGKIGETYTIGGGNEWRNIDLIRYLCDVVDETQNHPIGHSQSLITFVPDRAGHDLRYAIDYSKLKNTLGWRPQETFESGIKKTVNWYLKNTSWLEAVSSGEYLKMNQKKCKDKE